MTQKTPLHEEHIKLGAKMVDFGGWDMPLHYGSQLNEHQSVRQDAGIFDVSHMTIVDLTGEKSRDYLRYLLANDVEKLEVGKALYTCMLNEQGGIIDDLIVYFLGQTDYRLVVNASTRDKDLAWMHKQAEPFSVRLTERKDLAMIAAQGPNACAKLAEVMGPEFAAQLAMLPVFHVLNFENIFVARTGYTGEDGVEIILPATQAPVLWEKLIKAGFAPCGLGARDTLRLEAGLNLYGLDMDEMTTPLESNLSWTVALNGERHFIGRQALETQKEKGLARRLVGLILRERGGILRSHQKVFLGEEAEGEGEITSGTFSPTLSQSIALARIPVTTQDSCFVDIRGKRYPVQIVKPPFVKNGQRKHT
jgi:aminomethyltransferase